MLHRAVILLSLLVVACGDSTYGKAAAGAGVAVATVAVYRAVTHDCWGRCQPGYVCDRESGTCVAGECIPACGPGFFCARTREGELACRPDPSRFSVGPRPPRASSPPRRSPADAGRDGAGPTDAGPR